MEIDVSTNGKYRELFFSADNVSYSSGFMDDKESAECAEALLYAAVLLFPSNMEDDCNTIYTIAEKLREIEDV